MASSPRSIADGIKGKADSFGYEPDGLITIDELVKYVKKELPDLARANGKNDEEKGQQPLILEGQPSDFVLARNPAVTALVKTRLEQFEKIAKESGLPKSVAEEGRNYLHRMPKLDAQQELRKAYQKLADGKTTVDQFTQQRLTIVAGMKISTDAAGEYARHVMNAADVVIGSYFKKISQPTLVEAAIRGIYKRLDEPVPSDVKDKLDNIKNMQKADLLAALTEARVQLGKREDLDNGKDVTYSLTAMMGKLDRHSDYVDRETMERFKTQLTGKLSGIGVQIRKDSARDELRVITPIKDSPAYKAKIYAGDIITHIIREVDEKGNKLAVPQTIPTKGMSTDDAVKKIVGKAGTEVKIRVDREGESKPLEFTLIRGSVELETVVGYKRGANDDWDYVIDPENQICYVRLSGFQDSTGRDLERLMRKLYKDGIKGFILDLRFNPGGLLDQSVKISDLFIGEGMIVTIKPRTGPVVSYRGTDGRQLHDFPDGLPGQRPQRQRQRNCLGLPAGPRPGRHHGLAQLRQGQRANDRSVFRDRGQHQGDHRHLLAAQ